MLLPGPDMAILIANSVEGRRRRIFSVALGYATACVIHSVLVLSGLWLIVLSDPMAKGALVYFGAAFFVFVGITVLRSGASGAGPTVQAGAWPFAQGAIANLSNIKAIVYFIALYGQIIDAQTSLGQKALWVGFIFALSLFGAFAIGLGIRRAGRVLTSPTAQRRIGQVVGTMLIVIGLGLAAVHIVAR